MRIYNTKNFIELTATKHNNFYNYDLVEYINSKTKICIICPIHGEFWQQPNAHLTGQGCPQCGKYRAGKLHCLSNQFFINKAKQTNSKVEYKNTKTKVCIICPIHGEFWQTPKSHLKGVGCKNCWYEKHSELQTN